jgi:hypothetical protein
LTDEESILYGEIARRAQDYLFQERFLTAEGVFYEIRLVKKQLYDELSETREQLVIEDDVDNMLERSFGVSYC